MRGNKYFIQLLTLELFSIMKIIHKGFYKDMYFIINIQCNRISACAYNRNQDIIVTADIGDDSMLVVWDAKTGIPRKTIFQPHPKGVLALDVN